MPTANSRNNEALRTISWLGFLTGTLDAIAAIVLSPGTSPAIIFKFIASGYFGKSAFNGGAEMVVAGVIFHYLIAYLFTVFFYLLYPLSYSIIKNKYVVAVIWHNLAGNEHAVNTVYADWCFPGQSY
jgi:hypothetical protein